MAALIKTSVGPGPTILLVEEYHALAVAFRAALKRLSPGSDIRVCATLHEAEAVAAVQLPDLVIIDVDPPHRGAVAVFNRLQVLLPAANVLIIAPQKVPEPGPDLPPHAFQFIRKPFELEELSAAINRLLLRDDRESEPLIGTLRDLGLIDLILLLATGGATTILQVAATGGRGGEIHFVDGRICHAMVMGLQGLEALQEILGWPVAKYDETDRRTDAPRTIKGSWQNVLSQAWRGAKRPEPPGPRSAPAIEPSRKPAAEPPRKKLVVIDDTEMLLIFVEDILATANDSFEIQTAKSGLEGLDRIVVVKPDLVLLDYSLPDITGDEVCRRLLENPATARTPIIMMSGHVAEMLAVSERFENVIGTIAKPFLSKALVDLVERTMADLPRIAVPPFTPEKSAKPPSSKGKADKAKNKSKREAKPRPDVASSIYPDPQPAPEPRASETSGPLREAPPPPTPRAEEPQKAPPISPVVEPLFAAPQTALPEKALVDAQDLPPAAEETTSLHYREFGLASPQISRRAPASPQVAPAALQAAIYNAVVLHLPLEVVSLQFSPSLRMTSLRARPASQLVSLHILPQAIPGAVITEAGFEIVRVALDSRGQIDVVHLAPARQTLPRMETENKIPVENIVVLPSVRGQAVELTPMPAVPMRMHLLALFELCGVELSPEFGVGRLLLRSRGGKIRVSLQPDSTQSGATFETAQVLLDRSGRITEVLLDTLL